MARDVELVRERLPRIGQALATRLGGCRDQGGLLVLILVAFALGVERLALLRAVAVDREGLEAKLPTPVIRLGDVGRRDVGRHVDGLGNCARQEGLSGGHHADVGAPGDAANAVGGLERTVEHLEVLFLEVGRAFDGVVLVDVGGDRRDLLGSIAEFFERLGDGLVDDLEHAAAGELLVLHEGDIGLDARGIAVHEEADRAGRGEHGDLGIAEALLAAFGEDAVPGFDRRFAEIAGAGRVDLIGRVAMHLHHFEEGLAVEGVATERTDDASHLGAGDIGGAVHDCGDRAAEADRFIRVVGGAFRHNETAEIGIAEAERAELMAIFGDAIGGIARVIDEDFLGDEEEAASVFETLDIELAIGLAELHQVDAGEVAGRVIEEHVFGARIARVDATRVGAGVPTVDRGVVLDAGVTAVPGALGHAVEEPLGFVGGSSAIVLDEAGGPLFVLLNALHELIGHADREIGVLEQDRAVGFAIEVGGIAALFDEAMGLALFFPLALDEFEDVRMRDLEGLHLGGAASFAARLDHCGDLVVNAHEGERAGGLAAAAELFTLRTDRGKIGAGAGAELEEHRFAGREPHDVFHVVVDALDEAGRALRIFVRIVRLGDLKLFSIPMPVAFRATDAVLMKETDVEPNRRIEGAMLVEAEPRQVAIEGLAIFRGGEVAIHEPPIGDRAGHAMDELANAVFTFWGAVLAIEILADDDVGRELRPEGGYFTVLLFEEDLAIFVFDRSGAEFPIDGVKGIGSAGRTEGGIDAKSFGIHGGVSGVRSIRAFRSDGRNCCHTAQLLLTGDEFPKRNDSKQMNSSRVLTSFGKSDRKPSTLPCVFAESVVLTRLFPQMEGRVNKGQFYQML